MRAGTYLAESITRFREQDERWQSIQALEVCARWVAQRGRRAADGQADTLRAARLFGAAEALRETLGAPRLAIYARAPPARVASLRSQLDEPACAAAWAEGRAMTLEQALAYALEQDHAREPTSSGRRRGSGPGRHDGCRLPRRWSRAA